VTARIHRLPPALANQIAAGEVVERPASVVKELVENAVDAGATRIGVTIELGGKRLIQVDDDGEGMSAADAELAIERHATSKIRTSDDLAAIHTLGFRGEALPSIASVSHFRLRTRVRGSDSGTEVVVDGGRVAAVRSVGAPDGTLVEVADLFFNLPARRKFLKADAAESAQISRLMTQLALGYPAVGVRLVSAGRVVLEAPPVASLEARFYQIYGDRPDLVAVEKHAAGMTVRGFVAALTGQGPVRGPQHVFVNRRVVRDRTIAHAIQHAYSHSVVKERSPEVHLFIELPADRVDVNVHPTKAEVRFLDQGLVHEVLRRAVVEALELTGAPELVVTRASSSPTSAVPFGLSAPAVVTDALERSLPLGFAVPDAGGGWHGSRAGTQAGREGVGGLIRPMVPLGQFRNTFIIAADDEGLAIIDQHVAHERILFEQVMERLTSRPLESQRLLTPVMLELSAGEHQTLLTHTEALARVGFEIGDFGGGALRVIAAPAMLDWSQSEAALRAVAVDLDGLSPRAGVDDALRKIAATMACHAAVKANEALPREKMQFLLDELRRTSHSSVCPHGRPVVLRLTRREIERNFERI
jgi:DNA mismatch repair protein MutL